MFADAPILFFAVVIGVALTFRVAVGVVRDAAHPEPVAPTFATTSAIVPVVTGPEPGFASGTGSVTASAPSSTAEVGAVAKVQPIGSPPKPRGHGRRPIRGGDR